MDNRLSSPRQGDRPNERHNKYAGSPTDPSIKTAVLHGREGERHSKGEICSMDGKRYELIEDATIAEGNKVVVRVRPV